METLKKEQEQSFINDALPMTGEIEYDLTKRKKNSLVKHLL